VIVKTHSIVYRVSLSDVYCDVLEVVTATVSTAFAMSSIVSGRGGGYSRVAVEGVMSLNLGKIASSINQTWNWVTGSDVNRVKK
jgi:hypothetical protein